MSTQRRVTITTPLGDLLQLRQLQGAEALSSLFSFEIDLLSTSKTIDPKALLGQGATVVVETEGLGKRYLDGIVTRFGMQGEDHSNYSYRLRLQPWLWLATRRADFRIFQNQSVPAILQAVLAPYGFALELRTTRPYRDWDYCVQYNETDFNFVARLCEHEGIYWHFEHAAGHHTLVFADDVLSGHQSLPGHASIPFYPPSKSALAGRECISAWQLAQELRPGAHYSDDYDFKKPRADLSQLERQPPGHSQDSFEIYEWPGGFTEDAHGRDYARVRMQEHLSQRSLVHGTSNVRGMAPGYLFNLTNYPREDQNQQYLVTAVQYHFIENAQVSSYDTRPGLRAGIDGKFESEKGSVQRFELTAQPAALDYRPPRDTHKKPRVQGIETAVVVGPDGEEIWCDQYGRIKVQFHWDRLGQNNESSSCWMRVSAPWAGSNFGGIFIPRIGQEVIVSFVGGDPDYPLVTGCVYNQNNMPPWGLPGSATQSGFLTRSSKGGAPGAGEKNGMGDANALRFEDKAGAEQLWLHAQKDQLTEVEHDEDKWVGNDRRKTVDGNETNLIHKNRTETVDQNETITVHQNRTETVDLDETITIHGHRSETVDKNESITIHQNRTERVDLNETIAIGLNRNEQVGVNEGIQIGVNQRVQVGQNQQLDVGQDRSKTVGQNENDRIGQNWNIHVGKMTIDTIGLAKVQSAGIGRMSNYGVVYSVNVGMLMNTVVGLKQATQVMGDKTLTVARNYDASTGQDHRLKVGNNKTETIGQTAVYQAGSQLVLQCGGAKIVLDAGGGIYLQGSHIELLGSGAINGDAGVVNWNTGAAQAAPGAKSAEGAAGAGAPSGASGFAPGEHQMMDAMMKSMARAPDFLANLQKYASVAASLGIGGDDMKRLAQGLGQLNQGLGLVGGLGGADASALGDMAMNIAQTGEQSADGSAPPDSHDPHDASSVDYENSNDDGSMQRWMDAAVYDPLKVQKGQITFDAEGNDKSDSAYFSRQVHYPGGNSGVTIGRGYDMGGRTSETVKSDLQKAGMSEEDATAYSKGAGLTGSKASDFVKSNKVELNEMSAEVQNNLFLKVTYPAYENGAKTSYENATRNTKDSTSWEQLDSKVRDVSVDFQYQQGRIYKSQMQEITKNDPKSLATSIEEDQRSNQYEAGRKRAPYLRGK